MSVFLQQKSQCNYPAFYLELSENLLYYTM